MLRQYRDLILATAISGALSGALLLTGIPLISMSYGPGLFFGLVTSWIFSGTRSMPLLRSILWLISSTISWNVAIRFYMSDIYKSGFETSASSEVSFVGMLLTGAIGAFLLQITHWIIFQRIRPLSLVLTPLIGATAGTVMYLILSSTSGPYWPLMLAFMVWQVSVGLALEFEANRN